MEWSKIAREVVAEVLAAYPADTPERRKALRDAYPFGQREYWPYKAWLKAIKDATAPKVSARHSDQHTMI